MASVLLLRHFIREKLDAAAEEIFSEVEKSIRLLEISLRLQITQRPTELQQLHKEEEEVLMELDSPEPVQMKEEETHYPVVVDFWSEAEPLLIKGKDQEPQPPRFDLEDSEPSLMTADQQEPEPALMTADQEEPEPAQNKQTEPPKVEEDPANPEPLQVKEQQPEPALMTVDQEEPEPALMKADQEEPEPALMTADQEEPEPALMTVDQEEPEPALMTADQEEPEPALMTVDQEEPEAALMTADQEEPEPALMTADQEEPEPAQNKQTEPPKVEKDPANPEPLQVKEQQPEPAEIQSGVEEQQLKEKMEEERRRRLLDLSRKPVVKLHRIGRGVFATHPIKPGDFVLEYRGKLTQEECRSRQYSEIDFEYRNNRLCLGASEENGSLGRLVKDNHKNPNGVMMKIIVDDKPHLCLFSVKKIGIGDEIYYDSGKAKWPWRTEVKKSQAPAAAEEKLLSGKDQILTVQGFSLVDYPDSDEPDVMNKPPPPHLDVAHRQNDIGSDVSDHLYDVISEHSYAVRETCDEAFPSNHSNNQSNDELVPPLRHTKSILMDPMESEDSKLGSEEEYIPHPMDKSTESDCSMELTVENEKKNKVASFRQSKSKPSESGSESSRESGSESSTKSQFDVSQSRCLERNCDPIQRLPNSRVYGNEKEMPLEEEQSIIVSPTLKKDDGSRSYKKKHFCFYCRKIVQKMSRHLRRKHIDEVDVAKAFSFPKHSKERKRQLGYIRNKGNFEHNSDVLETRKGKLIPWRQPEKKSDGHKFAHCVSCYGLFSRRAMWRHFKVCSFKPESSKPGRTRVQALCAFAETAPKEYTDAYWKFLSVMNQDQIAFAIKGDSCILNYGFRLFKKNEKIVSQHSYIRQKLRELGRLLLEAKKATHVKTIQELIKPEQYTQVVKAAKILSGFSEETGKYQRPSLLRKVGHSLHSLAMFIKSEGLKKKDKETIQNAEEFVQLHQKSWRFDTGQALTQLNQAKWNAPQLLSLTQDIQKLHCYLDEKQQQHLKDLQEHPSSTNWKELAKVTLTQVMLFNRRRAGEVSRMRLSAYLSKDTEEEQGDVNLALTALEQKLCRHFMRIAIVGKRGRKVPVLLTPLMRESIDALTKTREECGVLKDNVYLFALPQSDHYLRACDCMRQFVSECADIKNPQALTSIKLRKHIATLSTVLNLKTTELDLLADLLGHNIAVHRKHYRLPQSTLQLAKVSKVLLAMERGRLGDYKGKSLDEIQVDVNETVQMEEPSEEDIEDVSMPGEEGSQDEVSMSSLEQCTSTSQVQNWSVSAKKRGKQTAVKRSWTPDECAAVNTHLKRFIIRGQVPGKEECQRCIDAEPQALRNRDWKAVKYYIKNRITALRRKV
ncbi:uncharacterized protein LOC119787925 isoform X2 [Cyprinodon tularosa]|uniref:uncharacterized protein LOC119787925 isoform X2 n=1 Tax=Cyprinodon tularosa TaxID=77115 RepID=UPI0018E25EB3|nr:uncharacterized protein LOC119787925 isoform X2 [Cyprinodon tularosa]